MLDSGPIRLLFFLHRGQDLDLALPVIRRALLDDGFKVSVASTPGLFEDSPRARRALETLNIPADTVRDWERFFRMKPDFKGVDIFFAVTESSARPHHVSYQLTQRANAAGKITCTIQHGLENLGLTYFDEEYGSRILFASQIIFTWGGRESMYAKIPESTARRCVPVGCPKDSGVLGPDFFPRGRRAIGVFENLHWKRYSPSYRNSFVRDLSVMVELFPEVIFLIKPHHDQRWLGKRSGLLPDNDRVILADPKDPKWEPYTAPALISLCDRVITTPSTVALDAARLGIPTAVAAYDLDLRFYEPLKLLRDTRDWENFIKADPAEEGIGSCDSFVAKHCVAGDASANILETLKARFFLSRES